jgi:hypothetical protein
MEWPTAIEKYFVVCLFGVALRLEDHQQINGTAINKS